MPVLAGAGSAHAGCACDSCELLLLLCSQSRHEEFEEEHRRKLQEEQEAARRAAEFKVRSPCLLQQLSARACACFGPVCVRRWLASAMHSPSLAQARPVAAGGPFMVHESDAPLTVPLDPHLGTEARAAERHEFDAHVADKMLQAEVRCPRVS